MRFMLSAFSPVLPFVNREISCDIFLCGDSAVSDHSDYLTDVKHIIPFLKRHCRIILIERVKSVRLILLYIRFVADDKRADVTGLELGAIRKTLHKQKIAVVISRFHTLTVDGENTIRFLDFGGYVKIDRLAVIVKLRRIAYTGSKRTTEMYQFLYLLKKFLNEQGKILPRRITGTSLKYQRRVAQAVKRARQIALLPYVTDMMK